MNKWVAVFLWCLSMSVLLDCCAVGGRHTSDAILERNFLQHEAQFEKLRTEIDIDAGLEMINQDMVRYRGQTYSTKDGPDFTQGWESYKRSMEELQLVQISCSKKGYIEFRVDKPAILKGDSYKAYVYSVSSPKLLKSSLDGYRISDDDKDNYGNYLVYKNIKGNWYLLLFVNG